MKSILDQLKAEQEAQNFEIKVIDCKKHFNHKIPVIAAAKDAVVMKNGRISKIYVRVQ